MKSTWRMKGQLIGVQQNDYADGSPTTYRVWIQWSDKLVLRHEHVFTSINAAERMSDKVSGAETITLAHWGRITGAHIQEFRNLASDEMNVYNWHEALNEL